jgi:hypothetical protein
MRITIVALALLAQSATPIFRFEADGFWVNLHHFLYVLGRAQNNVPDSQRRAVVNATAEQAQGLTGLSESHRQAWESAVRFYAGGLSKKDAVFDRELVEVTNAMRVAPNATAEALKVDRELQATLVRAASVYRLAWWSKHRGANHARIEGYSKQLERHGDRVLAFITRAYQEPWPKGGYPINLSGYSNWAGAYSTDGGLIVVSSLDEGTRGSLGLESIFHEAMHQWDNPVLARLERLAKEHQTPPPREGITHALIWYTAAAAVKSQIPNHVGYAESLGMWKQKGLGSFKAGLDAHWKPYLDGQGTLDAALVALLKS